MVRSFTPEATMASISRSGMPQRPKPPAAIVIPSKSRPSRAASALGWIFCICAPRTAVRAIESPRQWSSAAPSTTKLRLRALRRTVIEVEGWRPVLAVVRGLLAELADGPIRVLAVGHPHERTAPLAGDHHCRAVPSAGEECTRSAGVDPELFPVLVRRDVDAEAAAARLASRDPVFPNSAAVNRLDQAMADVLPLGGVDVPIADPEIELVKFGRSADRLSRGCRGGRGRLLSHCRPGEDHRRSQSEQCVQL